MMGTRVPRRRPASPHSRNIRNIVDTTTTDRLSVHVTPLGRAVFPDDVWRDLAKELRLSGRESEILLGIFDDQKESSIAATLGISTHTVHSHLERLYRKLRVSSRVTLVVRVFVAYLSNRRS
jgi:DNA-binding CsgD family transcriptional regulator